ncbi:MAG: hypothetical protein ACRD2C_10365 [Acidimicrobiales bacterium]
MATTDDETPAEDSTPPEPTSTRSARGRATPPSPAWLKPAKRYGPILAVALLIAGAIAIFGSGGGDDDDDAGTDGETTGDVNNAELIRSGPMTPQKAELEGDEDVDFGPNCDPETGRIRIPTVYAPPCVVPFEGDNGGATSTGVTADEILIIQYDTDPALDPLTAAQIAATGADVNPETALETVEGYLDVYNEVFETYGRTVVVEPFIGSGASDDTDAARADAVEIADMGAFAVIGGPGRAGPAFATALAEREVMCLGTCGLATPESLIQANQPYQFPTAPTPNQSAQLAAELIGNLAGPGPAELAGDEAMQSEDRVYGLLHFDNPDGDYEEVTSTFVDSLADNGVEIATSLPFELDLPRLQENARSMIARLEEDGVTTVIFTGDPLTPAALTAEATAQDYFPEWILAQSVLADTALFGRSFDQQQWVNGFGISLPPARGEEETGDQFRIYEWANGTPPPNNTYNILEPNLRQVFTGIHLAGENLTPETYREGLFRYPPSGGGPTAVQTSRGSHDVWPELDLGGVDDAAIIWWDPEAEGVDETGQDGVGLYRFANGGERYTIGNFPTSIEEAGLFDVGSSATIYDELPPEDEAPDYEPPDL